MIRLFFIALAIFLSIGGEPSFAAGRRIAPEPVRRTPANNLGGAQVSPGTMQAAQALFQRAARGQIPLQQLTGYVDLLSPKKEEKREGGNDALDFSGSRSGPVLSGLNLANPGGPGLFPTTTKMDGQGGQGGGGGGGPPGGGQTSGDDGGSSGGGGGKPKGGGTPMTPKQPDDGRARSEPEGELPTTPPKFDPKTLTAFRNLNGLSVKHQIETNFGTCNGAFVGPKLPACNPATDGDRKQKLLYATAEHCTVPKPKEVGKRLIPVTPIPELKIKSLGLFKEDFFTDPVTKQPKPNVKVTVHREASDPGSPWGKTEETDMGLIEIEFTGCLPSNMVPEPVKFCATNSITVGVTPLVANMSLEPTDENRSATSRSLMLAGTFKMKDPSSFMGLNFMDPVNGTNGIFPGDSGSPMLGMTAAAANEAETDKKKMVCYAGAVSGKYDPPQYRNQIGRMAGGRGLGWAIAKTKQIFPGQVEEVRAENHGNVPAGPAVADPTTPLPTSVMAEATPRTRSMDRGFARREESSRGFTRSRTH